MGQYLPLLVLFVLAVGFCLLATTVARLASPKRYTKEKYGPYECGIVPGSDTPSRFPIRFYLIAMLFLVFDVELVFLYLWAGQFETLGFFGLASVFVFSVFVFESLVYLVSKGALEWGVVNAESTDTPESQIVVPDGVKLVGSTRVFSADVAGGE